MSSVDVPTARVRVLVDVLLLVEVGDAVGKEPLTIELENRIPEPRSLCRRHLRDIPANSVA